MAPHATLNFFPPKQSKLVGKSTDSVTDRSLFPPKLMKSVDKATKSSGFSPERLVMQLVFTEFGLSPVAKMLSTQLPISPPKPYTTLHSSSPFSLSKAEPPRSHQQANMKTKYGAPKLQKQCRCKQSRCLKLYCECFAAGAYCDGCGCNCCGNNVENEDLRQDAMESILERNPNAFRPKIGSSRSGAQDVDTPKVGKHNWGCRCKKTKCLKKYCECFHAKEFCSKNCKCVNCKNSEDYVEHETLSGSHYNNSKICNNSEGYENSIVVSGGDNSNTNISKNFEGSEEQKAISNGNHGEANIYKHDENYFRKMCIKQANAAISAAVGLSGPSILQASRKRKLQKILDSNYEDLSIQRLSNHQKVNPFSVSSSLSAWSVDPIDHIDSSATLGSSEFHFSSKPSFTDIIQVRDVAELCSTLVLVSEATRKVLGKNDTSYIQAVGGNLTADITEVQDVENFQKGSNVQKETSDDHLSGNKDDFISEGIDLKEGRSSSPETIRLYSETDELSGTSKSDWIPIHGCNGDVYVEQERLVLTIFSDCLKKIILGNLKGKCQHVDYSIVKDGTATRVTGSSCNTIFKAHHSDKENHIIANLVKTHARNVEQIKEME